MKGTEDWSIAIEQVYERLALCFQTPGHSIRLPTVTTVHAGLPHSRTMVLRDIDDQNFVFFTDKRSLKAHGIDANCKACMHCYDSKNRMQLKVLGLLKAVENHSKMSDWKKEGLKRYTDYGSELPPGHPFPASVPRNTLDHAIVNFMVLALVPSQLEILQLNRSVHNRFQWTHEADTWKRLQVVP